MHLYYWTLCFKSYLCFVGKAGRAHRGFTCS